MTEPPCKTSFKVILVQIFNISLAISQLTSASYRFFYLLLSSRSVSASQRRYLAIGQSGQRPDPTVAIPARVAQRFVERNVHRLGGSQWRVQADRSRRGGATMGREEVQTKYELRQT